MRHKPGAIGGKLLPFKGFHLTPEDPLADLPEKALSALEWAGLITSQMYINPNAVEYCFANLDIDINTIEEIIRRIAKYGVIDGDPWAPAPKVG